MRSFALLAILLAGCWRGSPPPDEQTTAVVAPAPPPRARCPQHRVSGTLYDKHLDDEPVLGATVVLSGPNIAVEGDDDATLTDEQGHFSLRRRPGLDTITVYYADATFVAAIPAEPCRLVGRIASGLGGGSGEPLPLTFDRPKPR